MLRAGRVHDPEHTILYILGTVHIVRRKKPILNLCALPPTRSRARLPSLLCPHLQSFIFQQLVQYTVLMWFPKLGSIVRCQFYFPLHAPQMKSMCQQLKRLAERKGSSRLSMKACHFLLLCAFIFAPSSSLFNIKNRDGGGTAATECFQHLFSHALVPAISHRKVDVLLTKQRMHRNIFAVGVATHHNTAHNTQRFWNNRQENQYHLSFGIQSTQLLLSKNSNENMEDDELLERNDDGGNESLSKLSTEDDEYMSPTKIRVEEDDSMIDPIIILPLATISAIVLLGLGVLYTKVTNPVVDFDVDFYMALDGVRDIGGADALDAGTISGFPKLSPAEQLVGALFGPN
jgi:hypothetical protein